MDISIFTAIEIALSYPDQVVIETTRCLNGQYNVSLWRHEQGNLKLILSTEPSFDTSSQAVSWMERTARRCKESHEICLTLN